MERSKLIVELIKIAERVNLREEISTDIADNFIKKYSIAEYVTDESAQAIRDRFTIIVSEAQAILQNYNRQLNLLL